MFMASGLGYMWSKIWGFPEIWGTLFGVPIFRIIVFGGLDICSPICGKCQISAVEGHTGSTQPCFYPFNSKFLSRALNL